MWTYTYNFLLTYITIVRHKLLQMFELLLMKSKTISQCQLKITPKFKPRYIDRNFCAANGGIELTFELVSSIFLLFLFLASWYFHNTLVCPGTEELIRIASLIFVPTGPVMEFILFICHGVWREDGRSALLLINR